MTIKQLSIFIENKTGRINDVARILGKKGINMNAFSLADATDFGILRMIVSDVNAAKEALREAGFAVMLTDVVCLSCANKPGALSSILDILAREEIFIEYMYAFSEGDLANVVIRPTDVEKCIDTLTNNASGMVNFNTTY